MFYNNKKNKINKKESLVMGFRNEESLINLLKSPLSNDIKDQYRRVNAYKVLDALAGTYGEYTLFQLARCVIEDRIPHQICELH